MKIDFLSTSASIDMGFLETKESGTARHALGLSIFIKARAFSRMNKFAVVVASICFLMVVLWPAIVYFELIPAIDKNGSAIVQTVLSGLAAIFFSLHVTYKERQTIAEKALRSIAYEGAVDASLLEIASKVREVDLGVPSPTKESDEDE